jgi:hypothetical protein
VFEVVDKPGSLVWGEVWGETVAETAQVMGDGGEAVILGEFGLKLSKKRKNVQFKVGKFLSHFVW